MQSARRRAAARAQELYANANRKVTNDETYEKIPLFPSSLNGEMKREGEKEVDEKLLSRKAHTRSGFAYRIISCCLL